MNLYNIPTGTKNLKALFPAIDWTNVEQYYVEFLNADNQVCGTSNLYQVERDCSDDLRLHFVNYLGTVDSVTVKQVSRDHEAKSERRETSVTYPLDKRVHAINRQAVRSNNTYLVQTDEFPESILPWLEELADTPMAWVEFAGIEGQSDSFLPIVLADRKLNVLKDEERFLYQVQFEFTMSHETIIVRS